MARRPLDRLLDALRRPRAAPTATLGAPGTAIYGGFIVDNEKNQNLGSREERYKTFSEIMVNTSIVGAGLRYFLNLVAKAEWSFEPSPADTTGEFARRAETALTKDPETPWHRVVRRAAMYRFYGFSIQEWTARRRPEDGMLTYLDIAPRAQLTIDKWDTDETGFVLGVIQRSPQTQQDLYLPRNKIVYIVDDTLNDSPEGLGLFRHLTSPAARLARYEQLEGYGFETDLRGIPVGRGPFTDLAQLQTEGKITKEQRQSLEKPLRDFMENHIRSSNTGMLLDSKTYESQDEAGRASNQRRWDLELLTGSSTSFGDIAKAIDRLNHEMARILGVEQLLLGSDSAGSFALSRDKTNNFYLLVDSALLEIRETVENDLLERLWQLNGWPPEMIPEIKIEAVKYTDVEQVASTIREMATAGAVLDPSDPVINDVRDLLGVSRAVLQEQLDPEDAEDLALTGGVDDPEEPADDDEMPETPNEGGAE